jgi:release factor glutamine methyltransferase
MGRFEGAAEEQAIAGEGAFLSPVLRAACFPLEGEHTRAEALALLRRAFTDAGLDSPALDARILLTEALGIDAAMLAVQPETPIGEIGAQRLREWAARRLGREPVARIIGWWEFWGLPFWLAPETLVPRPETETVVETALRHVPDRHAPLRLLDLGAGSGCLLVALLSELPNAIGVGVDQSPGALRFARRNAEANGVGARAAFVASDWGSALTSRFDLIVSNPPYIWSADIPGLAPEVRVHDPVAGLDGGSDGLSAYRVILGEAQRLLASSGLLVVETGFDQGGAVRALAARHALPVLEAIKDLSGHARVLVLQAAL